MPTVPFEPYVFVPQMAGAAAPITQTAPAPPMDTGRSSNVTAFSGEAGIGGELGVNFIFESNIEEDGTPTGNTTGYQRFNHFIGFPGDAVPKAILLQLIDTRAVVDRARLPYLLPNGVAYSIKVVQPNQDGTGDTIVYPPTKYTIVTHKIEAIPPIGPVRANDPLIMVLTTYSRPSYYTPPAFDPNNGEQPVPAPEFARLRIRYTLQLLTSKVAQ